MLLLIQYHRMIGDFLMCQTQISRKIFRNHQLLIQRRSMIQSLKLQKVIFSTLLTIWEVDN